jgi:Ras-related protein Rab-2A
MSRSEPEPDYRFKVVLIGAAGSGKTAIVTQLLTGEFSPAGKTTIGVEYRPFRVDIKQNVVQLELWDTAGQETYRAVAKTYFRGAVGCILVYDTTNQATFDDLQFWFGQFRQLADPNALVLLAGNKVDLVDRRQVSPESAEQFAKDNLIEYIETSAATAHNVKEIFQKLAYGIFEYVQNGNLQIARAGEAPKKGKHEKEVTQQDIAVDIGHQFANYSCGC